MTWPRTPGSKSDNKCTKSFNDLRLLLLPYYVVNLAVMLYVLVDKIMKYKILNTSRHIVIIWLFESHVIIAKTVV